MDSVQVNCNTLESTRLAGQYHNYVASDRKKVPYVYVTYILFFFCVYVNISHHHRCRSRSSSLLLLLPYYAITTILVIVLPAHISVLLFPKRFWKTAKLKSGKGQKGTRSGGFKTLLLKVEKGKGGTRSGGLSLKVEKGKKERGVAS
jgi:hypothetical protein